MMTPDPEDANPHSLHFNIVCLKAGTIIVIDIDSKYGTVGKSKRLYCKRFRVVE